MTIIVFILVVAGFTLLLVLPFVIAPKIELHDLHKKFNNLKLNSVWIYKSESTNPFNSKKVSVIAKQMGTDGKTPWIIIKHPYGSRSHMKFEEFINNYIQI